MKYNELRPRAYFQHKACADRFADAIKRLPRHSACVNYNFISGGYTVIWV
jgi:hypothetical protein